jgi:tetratricopeptide (TPR) repeat protein
MPSPMLDFLERRSEEIANLPLAPWTTEDVAAFLEARSLAGDAGEIARIGQGRPAFVAELVEVLRSQDRLEDSLAGESLASLAPMALTEGELDPDAYPDTKRKVAGAEDIQEMAYRAALLGRGFPSGLLADIGGYDRESVDDLLDAAPDLFKEVQFSQPMQTWIYQFKKGIWRQGALDVYLQDPAKAAEGKEIGRRTALFLERFLVPQAYEFVVKTARLNAEVGELDRARMLRSMALSSGRPEIWAITRDLLKSLDEVAWPDPMRRTVYMNLLDRMVQVGDMKQADDLYNEALAWGSEKSDRSMEAWLLFAGSRLDYRRQDLYRARDRAQDAVTMYKALDDSRKQAEVETHLGLIELADGQLEKALEHVDTALELGSVKTPEGVRVLPQVAAQAEMVRGMAAKQGQKFKEAAGHFQKANEISGSTGQAGVALESGLAYGEALILSGKAAQAIDVLRRVGMIAQSLKNPMRQRAASALLGQAQGGLKKYQDALQSAQATLELTRQLKLSNLEPIDLYNVGFFQLMLGNPQDALVMFRQSKNMANLSRDVLFTKELLFNTGLAAARSGDMDAALETFDAALPAVRQAKDHAKLAATCEQLANLVVEKGDKIRAVALLEEGISAAEQANLPEQQETMNRKLAELQA